MARLGPEPAIVTEDPSVAAAVSLRVTAKEKVAEDVVTLTLARPDGRRLPDWTPGSHIDLMLPNGMTRQYSLCGDRWDAHTYRVGVLREVAGRGGSAYVHDVLAPGGELEGPAIVEERESTTVLPPGVRAVVDEYGSLHVT